MLEDIKIMPLHSSLTHDLAYHAMPLYHPTMDQTLYPVANNPLAAEAVSDIMPLYTPSSLGQMDANNRINNSGDNKSGDNNNKTKGSDWRQVFQAEENNSTY